MSAGENAAKLMKKPLTGLGKLGEVNQVNAIQPVSLFVVNYTDGNGKTESRLSFFAGDRLHMFSDLAAPSLKVTVAAEWLKKRLMAAIKTYEIAAAGGEEAMPGSGPTNIAEADND